MQEQFFLKIEMINKKPEMFIIDVDGVMTTGTFTYDKSGKISKEFGPDDHEALKILSKHIKIIFLALNQLKKFVTA